MSALNRKGDFEQRPHRYRFTDESGKVYAPFRLKPGVAVRDIIAVAFPDQADDGADWSIERA